MQFNWVPGGGSPGDSTNLETPQLEEFWKWKNLLWK